MSDARIAPHSPGGPRRWTVWIAIFAFIELLLMAAGGAWWWLHRQVDWEAVYSQNNRAIAVMDAFDYLEAVPEFEKVVQMAPDWLAGQINLGIALLNAGSKDPSALPRCRSVFEEILRRDPDNPYAHFCLGMFLMYEKEGTEAMRHFEAVLKVDPNDASSWYWLGSLNHKDRAKRLRCFEEALKRDKHLSGALYGLAMDMRDDEKRFNELLEEIEDLRRADWRNVSDVKYSQMGHYAEVIGRFGDRPPPPPTGPLALFQPKEALKVQLAPEAKWAKAADFGSDAVAELRRLVRARFGATMVVLDYNNDGKPDLFLAGAVVDKGHVRDLLLRNDGDNRFTDVTDEAGLAEPRPTLGCCVGDFDNDGHADLLLTGAGVQKLFRNRGDGTFKDVTAEATLHEVASVCLGAAFVDLDQDSDLDVLLCQFAANAEEAVKRLKGEKIAGGGLAVYLHVGAPEETKTPFDKPTLLDCKFRKASLAGLQGGTGISPVILALSDMDSDRDLDWLILDEQAAPIVVINDRLLRFRHSVLPDKVLPAASWNGALVLDADHDGRSDLLLLSAGKEPQLLVNHCHNAADVLEAWFKPTATNAPPLRQAVAVDLNLDSWTDVVGLSRDGLPVLLHNEGGRLVSQPEALGRDADWPRDLIALTVCPTNAAGRPNLFIWSENEGLRLYENRDNGGQLVWVNLLGRNAIDAERGNNRLRCNADAIGTWVVAQSGGVWAGQENTTLSAGLGQSRQPLLFGIARQPGIEALILRWPDGTLQGEPEKLDIQHPPPDLSAGQLAPVLQRNRLPGSCPILFAWDGRRFVFVNDFLGAGSIGETTPPPTPPKMGGVGGGCRPPRSEESIAIAAEQLAPRDGQYVLKITEPMDETTYLDSLQLVVVDHPPDVRVYPEERFTTTGPQPSQQLVAFGKEIYPIAARDQRGRDVTETLRHWDRVAVDDFAKRAWIGFAEEHWIELDFGERLASFGAKDRLYLCLAGWTEYPFPESSWAAHQAGITEQWPILERQDESGRWCSLGESGFPAGMPRMMLVDVTGKLTGPRCHLRLRTNMHICWDQAFVAADILPTSPKRERGRPSLTLRAGEDLSVRTTSLEVYQATLDPGRIPAEYSPDGRLPKLYDYHRGVDLPLVGQSGRLTRFGDVTELLHERDDRFVIFAPGDDLTVCFDAAALPPLPSGWKRSFFLRTAGYCKDTALSTAHGTTVEPLPFQAMRNYPYGAEQHYPNDALHEDYLRRYQSREVQANPWPRTDSSFRAKR